MTKKAAVALGLVLLSSCSAFAQTKDLPHLVFILADDMGYGDVSCYNPAGKIPTRHIDQLAAEGIRFTDAHSGGSSCIPSRYALMTGRFAARTRLRLNEGPAIEAGRMTTASLLHDHGYTTAMIGKWHLGFDRNPARGGERIDYSLPFRGGPVDRGFESFFGMHASLDIQPYFYLHGRSAVMPPTGTVAANTSLGGPEGWNHIQGAFWRAGSVAPDFRHAEVTPRFVREAVELIRSHGADHHAKPLFLYVALPSPHTPWLPEDAFLGKSGAGMYGDFVLQVDAAVGQIVDALDAAGMKQDTLLMFSSDNGPVWYDKDVDRFDHRASGPLRGMKFDSWEGGHRMPVIASWPGRTIPGSVSRQTIVFSDVFATLAELVGLEQIPEGVAEDSVSFLPYLLDADRPPEHRAPIIHNRWTVRAGEWKLILPRNDREAERHPSGQLYNLNEDLSERNNLVLEHPDIAQRLREQLSSVIGR